MGEMGFKSSIYQIIKRAIAKKYGTASALADRARVSQSTMSRYLSGGSISMDNLARIMDEIGVEVATPDTQRPTTRETVILMEDGKTHDDRYEAIPLVAPNQAALGQLPPKDSPDQWILVRTDEDGLTGRKNLWAVRLGRDQRYLPDVFEPGDIIIIDCDDVTPPTRTGHGNIFLVRHPERDGGEIAAQRAVLQRQDGQPFVTFYSDNPEFPPSFYNITVHYDGDMAKAVIGRIVYARTNLARK